MLIDSCASGGRRNDLETMRLSVPLHKTDYGYDDLPAKQAFHHTLSSWLPYYGAYVLPVDTVDVYAFRSSLAPMTMLTYDLRRRDVDWRPLQPLTEEWRRVTGAGYFFAREEDRFYRGFIEISPRSGKGFNVINPVPDRHGDTKIYYHPCLS
jgi:alpha-galactosidase